MLRLDRNDPLDRMVLQELNGEPVLFDTWLDEMDELAEEPDCTQILQERGQCAEEVLLETQRCRADFLARMSKQDLPLNNRFALCTALFSKAKEEPTPELLQIYCEVLSDPSFLLNPEPASTDVEDKSYYEEQVILQYLSFCRERDQLLEILTLRKRLSVKFSDATKEIRNPHPANCDTKLSYEIVKCFTERFELPNKGNGDILLGNLSNYMQIAASNPDLKSIEPLLLFRLLTKHQSRMCTVPDLNVSLSALWNRDKQQIDRNNGRNFKQYGRNLCLFKNLCLLYQNDKAVNLPLCWYGLDQVTVLGEFYRTHISAGWEYTGSESEYSFIPTVEEMVEDALFSCFPNGCEDNIVLMDSNITPKELDRFRQSEEAPILRALDKISDYMNARIVDLAAQMARATPEEVKALCRDILQRSGIRYRPKSPHETELFLAAINGGLMDCQDWLASYLLAQGGHALLGEPTEISEWTE